MINRRLLQAMLATALVAGSMNIVSAAAAPAAKSSHRKLNPVTMLCLLALLSDATASDAACPTSFLDDQISDLEYAVQEANRWLWMNIDPYNLNWREYAAAKQYRDEKRAESVSLKKERNQYKTYCESMHALKKASDEAKEALREENARRTCANNATTGTQTKQSQRTSRR